MSSSLKKKKKADLCHIYHHHRFFCLSHCRFNKRRRRKERVSLSLSSSPFFLRARVVCVRACVCVCVARESDSIRLDLLEKYLAVVDVFSNALLFSRRDEQPHREIFMRHPAENVSHQSRHRGNAPTVRATHSRSVGSHRIFEQIDERIERRRDRHWRRAKCPSVHG